MAASAPIIATPAGRDSTFGYDGFGRPTTGYEDGIPQVEHSYAPLVVVTRDAEQSTVGSHIGASTQVVLTGEAWPGT